MVKISSNSIISRMNKDTNIKNQEPKTLNLRVAISMNKAKKKIHILRLFHKAVNNFINS